jgi:hypothetical protein
MRIRLLFAMLLVVAMSFAPLAMAGEQAMAAAPAHHAEMDASAAHCPDQSGQDQPDQPDGKPCCAAGCTAAAMLAAKMAEPLVLPRPQLRPSAEQFHRGTLSEIATPPPRPA